MELEREKQMNRQDEMSLADVIQSSLLYKDHQQKQYYRNTGSNSPPPAAQQQWRAPVSRQNQGYTQIGLRGEASPLVNNARQMFQDFSAPQLVKPQTPGMNAYYSAQPQVP